MLFFIRRGRENQREMTVTTFDVGQDASSKRYVYQVAGEVDKNHDVNDAQHDTTGEGRMYETGTDRCPYKTFLLYKSKLNPKQKSLWQRAKTTCSPTDAIWYVNAPIGVNTLGNMMSKLSVKYGLSQKYTNHSLRVTSLQALNDANIEVRHIVRVSEHKSETSIKHYARTLSAGKNGIFLLL